MGDLKAAVIGAGTMGSRHARVYAELAQTDLVAIADLSEVHGARVAGTYGVTAYTDFHEMLDRARPDVVTVAVPASYHRAVAEVVFGAGAHVLVEKPIATTVGDAQALISAAQVAGRTLMVGHIMRFDPAIRGLKERIDAGEVGRVYQIACRRISSFPERIRDIGAVLDLAPHDLDLMRYLAREEPIRVYAETGQQIHDEHEDLVGGLVRFASGITGLLELNWLTPMKVRDIFVLGENGMFRADCVAHDLTFYENGHVQNAANDGRRGGVRPGRVTECPLAHVESLKVELMAFAEAVLGGSPAPVTGEDGLAALQLALALLQSAREGRVVEVA